MCFLTVFLYILGTVQGFMDSTQSILLGFGGILGILLALCSLFGIILNLAAFFKRKKGRYIVSAVISLFSGVFGVSVTMAASFIIVISGGNVNV